MTRPLDVLFVNPDSSFAAYQELSKNYSAVEPPTWALLLAQSCRSQGYGVAILDCGAERLTIDQSIERIAEHSPRIVCFVMYGQNPNSGTTSMIGAELLGAALKREHPELLICFVGSHVSALPKEVLSLPFVDIVLLNEGVYALRTLLQSDLTNDSLRRIKGIGHKANGIPMLNDPEKIVPQELMDIDLPGYAWDLLPYERTPLDLYRSHFWHAGYNHENRSPFAAIYTSLGCVFKCSFCMINILNRIDNGEGIAADSSPVMRYWSSNFMLDEMQKLANMGVNTLRLSDEMFYLNRKHFEPLLTGIVERGLDFNMWAYSRVDTVNPRHLDLFKQAGVNWLALGIESGNQNVRQDAVKGSFRGVDIHNTIEMVHSHDMKIIANYIFGLPEDTHESMQETLKFAQELNTHAANMYPCQALPGSPLYLEAKRNGWKLPDNYSGYAFLSYDAEPLPTKYCTAAEVVKFRDHAWHTYHSNPQYLDLIEQSFGPTERKNIEEMSKIKLRRKILGDTQPEK